MQTVSLKMFLQIRAHDEVCKIVCGDYKILLKMNENVSDTITCLDKICPPPPYLQHGDYSIINSTKDNVITAVSYTCQSYYVLTKQQGIYKCVDGKWETPPKCLSESFLSLKKQNK